MKTIQELLNDLEIAVAKHAVLGGEALKENHIAKRAAVDECISELEERCGEK